MFTLRWRFWVPKLPVAPPAAVSIAQLAVPFTLNIRSPACSPADGEVSVDLIACITAEVSLSALLLPAKGKVKVKLVTFVADKPTCILPVTVTILPTTV
jgi:hypothetical protein|tara:strand:+ start:247 stop:543 length:297 start_codon:yes stop_codon:yes gene_type:complete